jgi:hypothetical protein
MALASLESLLGWADERLKAQMAEALAAKEAAEKALADKEAEAEKALADKEAEAAKALADKEAEAAKALADKAAAEKALADKEQEIQQLKQQLGIPATKP